MSGTSREISVVVPVTEPDVQAREIVEGYGAALRSAGYRYEFVFVLDGLGGAVERELKELKIEHPVRILRLHGSGMGESVALSAGVDRAVGEFLVNAPQYLQAEPEDVVKIVQALENGADFVATWRHPRVDPWLNRVQSRFFNWFLRCLMGIRFHDLNSGLRGMRRQVLEEVGVYGEMYRFLPVLAMRQGFRTVEVKVRHREEKGSTGFYGVGVYVRRLLDILAVTFLARFTQKPLRFFGMIGLLSMLAGAALSIGPLWDKLSGESLQNRPIFVLGAILVAFGIQLIGFGLVGEIVIFTQAGNLRDYKIDEHVEEVETTTRRPLPAAPGGGDGAPLRVRELLPGEDARWDAWVRAHEHGTFFHLSGWRKVVEDTFRHRPFYLVAERGKDWAGILPLFWVKSLFLGKNLISTPYAVYGGPLAADAEAATALRRAAAEQGRELGAGYVELRQLHAEGGDNPTSDLYVTFRKELPDDPEAVLPAIPKKARAEVRRARDRFGIVLEEAASLDELFELFVLNKRRLGSPSLPRRWFEGLRDEFGRQVAIHVARDPSGEALAAVMSFCFEDTVYAYYSGSRHERHRTGVNDFMYCKLMEWSIARGHRIFDFGRSRRDTGPARFKKNMGFEPQALHYEYLLLRQNAEIPVFHPSNPRLRVPRRIWSALPVFLTTRLGGRLSRYLP